MVYYISFGHLIICSLHSLSSPFYLKSRTKKCLLPFFGSKWNFNNPEIQMVKKFATLANYFCSSRAFVTHSSILSAHTWYIWYIILHSLQNPLSCLQMSVWVDKIGWWNNLLSWFTNSLQDLLWFREQHFVYLYICTLKISLNYKINTNYISYIYVM